MWQSGIFLRAGPAKALAEADYVGRKIVIRANEKEIIRCIKEELEDIAGEGKIRPAKTGAPLRSEEYWRDLKALQHVDN